jgi:KDO2-lipid IV(A) lauroyltransferase
MKRRGATYAALCVVATIVARVPRRARASLGSALGFLAGSVFRIRRALVAGAMARAGIVAPDAVAAAMYRRLGRGVFDLLHLAGASAAERDLAIASVVVEGSALAAMDAALARGPVIFFASHTGNWELAAAAAARLLATRKRRLAVVAKAMHARGVDAFVMGLRRALGVEVILPTGAFANARRALRAGHVLVTPIDQVPDRSEHGMEVRFLRETAWADRAPATLAWRAKATVLVVAALRDEDGERVRLLDTIPPPPDGARSRIWIDDTTRRATAALDAFVLARPESWLWLHRRWRQPRPPQLVATTQAG